MMKKLILAEDDRPRTIPKYILNLSNEELDEQLSILTKTMKPIKVDKKILDRMNRARECGLNI